MNENEDRSADMSRLRRLKQLSVAGMIDRQASYFNHLIEIYGDLGRPSVTHTFTVRERERVDMFLESFAK